VKKRIKCIGSAVLITVSFVFLIGMISSIAMMIIKNGLEHMALISGMAQAAYLLIVVLILKTKKIDIKNTYGLKVLSYKAYILPVIAAFCFSAFSNIIQSVAPIPQELIGGMSEDMEKSMVAFVLSVFLLAPFVEEFVFRGLIMTKLRKHTSVVTSILISALLFALIHIMAGGVVTMIHAFLGGIIFALAYEKTKSLYVAIVAHIFGNVGGYIPTLTNLLPDVVQYVVAVVCLVIAADACAKMGRKTTE